MKKYLVQSTTLPIHAKIEIPGSKSITNRALILAALAQGKSVLSGVLESNDTLTCINALKALGVPIKYDIATATYHIEGNAGKFPKKEAILQCHDSGTTLRFLLAVCAATFQGECHFICSEQLSKRPLTSLITVLQNQGVEINLASNAITLKPTKNLSGGNLYISGKDSSQFLSGLLMAAPYAAAPLIVETSELVSEPYIHMTCQMMQEFGITVQTLKENSFYVNAPEHYMGRSYVIEPDLTTASYFFAAAALTGGEITVPHISKNSCKQGDIAFLEVLEKMGCIVEYRPHDILVRGNATLRGQIVNMKTLSDTMMTLACIAPFASTPTTITGIEHTRYKESDRIEAVVHNLNKLGIQTQQGKDYLTVFPGDPKPGLIDTYNDHRIAMSFALIGLRVPGIEIQNIECVNKTCPHFIQLWEQLWCH